MKFVAGVFFVLNAVTANTAAGMVMAKIKPLLSNSDFVRAAKRLSCEVAAIKAVAEVESRGQGFYPSGFPVILFERHKFRSFTQGRYNQTHPHLSGPAGGYGRAGQHQVNKFNEAFALNPNAAMKSCSWGKFQIMGFNHVICGYATVGEFVDAMKESEGKQLDAFVSFVIENGLAKHLRNKTWTSFAKGYNGANYRINHYDTKMASAYARHLKDSAASPAVEANQPSENPTELVTTAEPQALPTIQNAEQIINTGDQSSAPPPEDKTLIAPAKDGATATATTTTILGVTVPPTLYAIFSGISDLVEKGYVDAKEIGSTLLGLLRENYKYVFILIGLIIVILIVKKIVKQVTFWIQMITAAVPQWNTIKVVPTVTESSKWWQIWK